MKFKRMIAGILGTMIAFNAIPYSSTNKEVKTIPLIAEAADSADNMEKGNNPLNENKSFLLDTEGETSSNVRNNSYYQSINSYLFETSDKCFNRVEYNNDHVIIEKISPSGLILSNKTISPELPKWGGFYAGANNYYMVWGQNNLEESNSTEVMRIVKYSKDWNRISSCSIYGANTYEQFKYGTLRMDEVNGQLIIHCSHTMYKIEDNLNHQANMTYVINESTMTVNSQFYAIGNASNGYASHSFNQFVKADGNILYRVDHGDADPTRGIAITKSNISTITNCSYNNIFKANGTSGYNATGISVGGFEMSDYNGIIAGNSIDQNVSPWTSSGQRNVFVSIVNKDSLGAETKWITSYPKDSGITVRVPILIKVNSNTFVIMWEEEGANKVISTKIVTINESGTILTGVKTLNVRLSDCQPIIASNGNITWYYTENCSPIIYSLNLNDLTLDQSIFEKEVKWDYNTDNATLTVSCDGEMPNYNSGGQPWNNYNSEIKKIIIQSGTTSISNNAFFGMEKLRDVEIPSTVKSIGSSSFQNCFALDHIKLPNSITQIGDKAFYRCTNLYSIDFDANIQKIGEYAFGYAYDFSNNPALISDDIKIYGYTGSEAEKYAIENNIQFIDKSDYITELQYSFDETTGTLLISGQCPIRDYDNYKNKAPWADYKGEIKKVIIEEGITRIGNYSFYECANLESISIPDTVVSIGSYAFSSCEALNELQLPDSVTSIESYAFYKCIKIPSLLIPESTTRIENSAFATCIGLTNIEFENGVVEIGDYAFYNCHSVKVVELPDSLKSVGKRAFHLCNDLYRVTIPKSVESIGERAFGYVIDFNYNDIKATNYLIIGSEGSIAESYANENNIRFASIEQISSSTTTTTTTTSSTTTKATTTTTTATSTLTTTTIITTSQYQGFYYKKIENGVEIIGLDEIITGDVIIPEEIDGLPVIRIGEYASLIKEDNPSGAIPNNDDGLFRIHRSDYVLVQRDNITSVSIPSSVKEIGDSAFYGCKNLKQISLSNGLERIEPCAFIYSGITELKLPDSVKYIGASAFYGCQDLSNVSLSKNLEFLGMNSFAWSKLESNISTGNFIVDGWYITYKSLNDSYPTILNIPEGTTGIAELSYSDIYGKVNDTTKIVIPSSVKTISDNAFRYYLGLKEFDVATDNPYFCSENGVLYNKNKSQIIRFPINSSIVNYKFPETITSTRAWAFCNCKNLKSVTMNNELLDLGGAAFIGCKNLTYVTISKNISKLYSNVYSYIAGGKGNIENEGTFQECDALEEIIIPEKINYIGDATFAYCKNLKKVTVKNPDCEIINDYDYETTFTNGLYDDNFNKVDIIELYGYKDSTLQAYAQKFNKKFVEINESFLLGDVNSDGSVDASDAGMILNEFAILGAEQPSTFDDTQKAAGDINEDGSIDGTDASLVLRYYAYEGKIAWDKIIAGE